MESEQSRYKNVATMEDHEENLSNTEVDDSLLGDEKQWHNVDLEHGKRSRQSRLMATFLSFRSLLDTVLLLVIIALLFLLRAEWHGFPRSSIQVGGDFTGAGPIFDTKMTKWDAHMEFVPSNLSEFFSESTRDTWNTMMPAGTGWGSRTENFATTSMTHQLHCLFMMGRVYAGVVTNVTQNLPEDYHAHFLHCIDYLRQGIMCAGDVSLEVHTPNDSDDLGPLDGGWNAQHMCKDYNQIKSYLEQQIKDGVRTVLPIDD